MPNLLVGRIVVIILCLIVFWFGLAGLRSGETRSRGHKFNRDENPMGYWFAELVSLGAPIIIIYLILTR